MSLFDQNQWYQIRVRSMNGDLSMTGLAPTTEKSTAAVFFHATNASSLAQRWQMFPMPNSRYILRNALSGGEAYLGVRANTTTESTTGGITAVVRTAASSGSEAFWRIEPFNNGYFDMSNVANGTSWNLFVKDAGLMAMTSDIVGQQTNQSFNFTKVAAINDGRFSTIQNPTATATATTTATATATASLKSTEHTSGGLSNAGKVAIIATICTVLLIVAIVGMLVYLHRGRKRKNLTIAAATKVASTSEDRENSSKSTFPKSANRTELSDYTYTYAFQQPRELESGQRRHPQELPYARPDPIELPARGQTNEHRA